MISLRHHGVTEFASRNEAHFADFGFSRVWNPLLGRETACGPGKRTGAGPMVERLTGHDTMVTKRQAGNGLPSFFTL